MERLSSPALEAIQTARLEGGLAISSVTLYELACLVTRNRVVMSTPLSAFLEEVASRFIVKNISAAIAIASVQLTEPYPKDPMDRLIGATALVNGIPLITADERIRQSGQIQTVW